MNVTMNVAMKFIIDLDKLSGEVCDVYMDVEKKFRKTEGDGDGVGVFLKPL